VHELSRRAARRIAVRAQLLSAPRPTELLDVVRHLTLLQADPTKAVAPSAELVVWTRLGSAVGRQELAAAVRRGELVEVKGFLRPAEDVALLRAEMAAWPGPPGRVPDWRRAQQDWIADNTECHRDILRALYDDGPLPTRELPDTTLVPWESSGWNNDRNVRMLLELMISRGEVAAAGWDGAEKLWDLAERVYPDVPVPDYDDALAIRAERRLRALGLARARAQERPVEPGDVGGAGEPATVEGVRGAWRVDPTYLEGSFRGRTALLSPLDQLVFDRKRMAELFEFDYQLEMYKPKAKRRFGYWALPILHGDQLVGKVDATADRAAGVLRVDAVHEDGDWPAAIRTGVDRELRDLARWLDLDLPE